MEGNQEKGRGSETRRRRDGCGVGDGIVRRGGRRGQNLNFNFSSLPCGEGGNGEEGLFVLSLPISPPPFHSSFLRRKKALDKNEKGWEREIGNGSSAEKEGETCGEFCFSPENK